MARRATQIAQERNKGGLVLVLDAGDSLAGDQDPARKTQGKTSIEAMNRMGYDAMALGPQDLALGPAVLQQRMAEAQFAVLSANATLSSTGKLIATPYVVREMDGHRIALVGISGGNGTAQIAVGDPVAAAREAVATLAGRADAIILLSHAGMSVDRQIADTIPGIAAILSGGAPEFPTPWQSDQTGTLVLRADEAMPGHAGRMLGVARLALDRRGRLIEQSWQDISLSPEIADDPTLAAWVQQQTTR